MNILLDLDTGQIDELEALIDRLRTRCGVRRAEYEADMSRLLASGKTPAEINAELFRVRRRRGLISRANLLRVLIARAVSAAGDDLDELLETFEANPQVRVQGRPQRAEDPVAQTEPPKPKFKPVLAIPPKVGHIK